MLVTGLFFIFLTELTLVFWTRLAFMALVGILVLKGHLTIFSPLSSDFIGDYDFSDFFSSIFSSS